MKKKFRKQQNTLKKGTILLCNPVDLLFNLFSTHICRTSINIQMYMPDKVINLCSLYLLFLSSLILTMVPSIF